MCFTNVRNKTGNIWVRKVLPGNIIQMVSRRTVVYLNLKDKISLLEMYKMYDICYTLTHILASSRVPCHCIIHHLFNFL